MPAPAGLHLNTPDDDTPIQFTYLTQSGDTLEYIAERFELDPEDVNSVNPVGADVLLTPGETLYIPKRVGDTLTGETLLPDSEVVYSPSVADFSVEEFVQSAGGYLSRYKEHVYSEWLSGAEIVERVAVESSVNPKVLLAVIEERSGWVLGEPPEPVDE